jgi:hypothetical protein
MATKAKECQSYTINALRKASADLDQIESKISEQILAAAKNLLEGGHIDPSSFAGNFRVYEMVQDRFDTYKEGFELHQERCGCDIPNDLDGIW